MIFTFLTCKISFRINYCAFKRSSKWTGTSDVNKVTDTVHWRHFPLKQSPSRLLNINKLTFSTDLWKWQTEYSKDEVENTHLNSCTLDPPPLSSSKPRVNTVEVYFLYILWNSDSNCTSSVLSHRIHKF